MANAGDTTEPPASNQRPPPIHPSITLTPTPHPSTQAFHPDPATSGPHRQMTEILEVGSEIFSDSISKSITEINVGADEDGEPVNGGQPMPG